MSEVSNRLQRTVDWVTETPSQWLNVRLRTEEEEAFGVVTSQVAGAPPTERHLRALTCDEVASALAMIVALTLEQGASAAPTPSPPPAGAHQTSAPWEPESDALVRADDPSWLWAAAPALDLSFGNTPEPIASLGIALGLRWPRETAWDPSIQLTALWGETGTTGPAVSSAIFTFVRTRLDLCPVRWSIDPRFGVVTCASIELGQLRARAAGNDLVSRPVERLWFATGASGGAHIAGTRGFAELLLHAFAALTRDEFVRTGPHASTYRPARLGFGSTFAVGVEF